MDQSEIEQLRKFHTERREKTPQVTIEKSSLPMLWLDSSVLIDFAKILRNERVEKTRAAKLNTLKVVVRDAVRAEKLLCPEWEQSLEYEGKRLESEIRKVVSDLSCGAHCIPYAGVKDRQMAIGMKAYLALSETMHIPSEIHFYDDPAEAVRAAKRNRCYVESGMAKPAEWFDKATKSKQATQAAFEQIRLRCREQKQTFDDQLAAERIGESNSMIKMVADFEREISDGKVDIWSFLGVEGFFQAQALWSRMGGPGPELPALFSYMRSPYYWGLPIVDVACRLSADLMVNQFPVKSGDHLDMQHLATAIPVAHFVVTDKAMVDRCERLGICQRWDTKLFSTRILDKLCAEIIKLPNPGYKGT